jgi:hypothetical protein
MDISQFLIEIDYYDTKQNFYDEKEYTYGQFKILDYMPVSLKYSKLDKLYIGIFKYIRHMIYTFGGSKYNRLHEFMNIEPFYLILPKDYYLQKKFDDDSPNFENLVMHEYYHYQSNESYIIIDEAIPKKNINPENISEHIINYRETYDIRKCLYYKIIKKSCIIKFLTLRMLKNKLHNIQIHNYEINELVKLF